MSGDIDPDRFEKEALYPARAASHSHHVLNIHDFFREPDGTCYLVTDLIPHGDLVAFLKVHQPLSLETAVSVAIGIAKGLCAIHQQGIIHLDLKPANVLMDRKDEQWTPKIADFGLARSDHSQISADAASMCYSSPEHFDTRVARTAASDMFSFGMVLFEMVTGKKACGDLPDLSAYIGWLMHTGRTALPGVLSAELAHAPGLSRLVGELLAFDLADRTVTAADAVRRLTEALPEARPVSSPVERASERTPALVADVRPATGPARPNHVPIPVALPAPVPVPAPATRRTSSPVPVAALLMAVLALAAAAGWFLWKRPTKTATSEGMTAYVAGNYAKAFPLLLREADAGSSEAQRTVAGMYASGLSVPRNPTLAKESFERAIEQDDAQARCGLADLYASDALGPPDPARASTLYAAAAPIHVCGHRGMAELLLAGPPTPGSFDQGLRELEVAADGGDARSASKLRELQTTWTLAPLVPGAWQPVVGKERRDELSRLSADKSLGLLQPLDSRLLRRLDVEFYDQTALFELEVGRGQSGVGIFAYLRRPDGIVPVNGDAAPINRLNAIAPVRLDSAQRVAAYLKFYQAGAVRGRSGLFRVVDDPGDLHWLPGASPTDRQEIDRRIQPLRVERSASGWNARATLSYSASLLTSALHIGLDGSVSPTEEPEVVAPRLPIASEQFDARGVRVAVVPAAAPLPAAPGSGRGRGGGLE